MTLLAIVVGPFGVALGFGLTLWGEHVKAQREADNKQHEQAASRALGLLAAADAVQGEGSILAYVAYLRETGQHPGTDQVKATIDRFNSAITSLSRLTLEADVLGPDGLGEVGRMLQARTRDLSNVVNDMNLGTSGESVRKVQNEILPTFHAAIEQATVQTRVLLNAYASPRRAATSPDLRTTPQQVSSSPGSSRADVPAQL
jgi:hypothetical protein